MADNTVPSNPLGQDSIKGGIFFGSNLTPTGTFSNVPNMSAVNPPTTAQTAKIILTLQQVKEDLQKQAAASISSTTNVLSDSAANLVLQSVVQLLIDYSDLRNFIFFGSAFTELSYHINFLVKNYPYLSYFAKNVGAGAVNPANTVKLTYPGGNTTQVQFGFDDVLQAANYVFDLSGATIWTNFDLQDKIGTRYAIQNASFTKSLIFVTGATNTPIITITTNGPHSLNNGDSVTINNVLGNTNANGTFIITNVTLNTFDLIGVSGNALYISGGSFEIPFIPITNATNTPTISITTAVYHNLTNGDVITIQEVLGNTNANGQHMITVTGLNTFNLAGVSGNAPYISGGFISLNEVTFLCAGNININNFIEFDPNVGTVYKGLMIAPKAIVINDFTFNLDPVQKELLDPNNPTPWPRAPITNNILTQGNTFTSWINNPTNMVANYSTEDGTSPNNIFDPNSAQTDQFFGLNLTGANTLDDNVTNQLLRRAIPHRLIDELRDTDDKFFTRFVLLAGKFFDSIKVYIDFIKYTKELNYTPFDQLSPEFYKAYASHYGFDLFDDENIDLAKAIIRTEPGLNYDSLNNPVYNDPNSAKTVQELQNEKQKRLLINLFFLYSTKGTLKCIETLARLLGSPEGLVVFQEFVFDQSIGQKVVDNKKVKVPSIAYEIDPDFLANPINVSDPVNLPYVYRLKLDNENIINLRELNGFTDPQGAIENQVVAFGTTIYPYGHFNERAFATLQNNADVNGYYLLPLSFPNKFCGITVEYMLPKNGFVKGVGQGFDEATIHIGSLFQVDNINYTAGLPDKLASSNLYAYRLPQTFAENIVGNTAITPVPFIGTFTISGLGVFGQSLDVQVDGSSIGTTTWQTTKKATALAIMNAINFNPVVPKFAAYYQEDPGGLSFTVTVESDPAYTAIVPASSTMSIFTNAIIDSSGNVTTSPIALSDGVSVTTHDAFIIARMEGPSLVIRLKLYSEFDGSQTERVALMQNVFVSDGLNHELRLIYRPEGVEVYQDFHYLGLARWLDPTTALAGSFTSLGIPNDQILTCSVRKLPNLFAYPDQDPSNFIAASVSSQGLLEINQVSGTVNNILVIVGGVQINTGISYIGSNPVTLALDIATAINAYTSAPNYTAVAVGTQIQIIQANAGTQINDAEILIVADTTIGTINYNSYSTQAGEDPNVGINPGIDAPRWWDLFIGLPTNVDMFFKRVAVQEMPSINHPDSIDFGHDPSGFDVEKFSFNFANQKQVAGNFVMDGISIPCDFRVENPFPAGMPVISTPTGIDLAFSGYPNNLVTDLTLINQSYMRNAETRFVQDVQNFFKLPSGVTITIDSLFEFNGWSYSLHKDYDYDNFNRVFENYQIFSQQVLTYLALLPFMELIESRFRVLVGQFIPIVVNLANFGRLVRPLEKLKVHYPNIHKICQGQVIGSNAKGTFRIIHGSNNQYVNLNNSLDVKIKVSKFISNATNATPIVITTTLAHGFSPGDSITIIGVNGNTAANGTFTLGAVTPTTFILSASVGNGAYTGGGIASKILVDIGTLPWQTTNSVTATIVAGFITMANSPNIVATATLNSIEIDVDPIFFLTTYNQDINDCELLIVVNGNVQVDNIGGFGGGYPSIPGPGCFVVTVTNSLPVPPGFNWEWIYEAAEHGLEMYIYEESEIAGPGPYIYIY
jgi:hypothetical protein